MIAITLNGADVFKVQRDKLGRELKRHQANGITQQCDFDSHGRLQQQKWTSEHDNSHRRQYHYDSASQLIAIQDNALGRQQFSYDSLNQLQAHHQNNTTTNYQFDSFGNPRLGNPDFEECESTNDRLQRYQSKIFDYDKCGNQATVRDEDSGQHRQFNGFNQLTQLSHNGRYSHYDYDALGRRSRKTTEQHTVDFLWDGDQLIGEHSQGQYRWYIYAPNDFTPLALIDNGALYYYHTDHLGTPHTVTDSEGDVVWQATYNALGCAFISVDIIHNPLRFQGQYHDQESSLHYNRFRYYDPSIGQFIHQDPIGLLGGINHYRYAPNPIQWVDPLGLSCKEGKISPLVGPRASHTSYPLYPVSPDVMVESKAYGYGLVEVFAAGAYNSGIDVAAGLAGLATLATGGSLNDSAELIEKVQSNYGYTPSSEGAQMLAQDLAPYLNEYEQTMSAAGDYVLDATGSPLAATLTHKSFEVAGTIAGGKMLLNSVKRSVVKSNSKLFNGVTVDDIKLAKSKGASLEHIQARKNVTLDYMNENGFTKDQIFDALGSPDGSKDGGFDLTQPVEVMTFPPPDSMSQYVASHGYPGNWFDPLSNQRPDLLGISGEGRTLKHFKVVQGTGLKSTAKPVIDTWTTPEKPLFTNGGGIQLLVNDRVKSAISEINSIGI